MNLFMGIYKISFQTLLLCPFKLTFYDKISYHRFIILSLFLHYHTFLRLVGRTQKWIFPFFLRICFISIHKYQERRACVYGCRIAQSDYRDILMFIFWIHLRMRVLMKWGLCANLVCCIQAYSFLVPARIPF